MLKLRNLLFVLAFSLCLQSCVYVPWDYYPPPRPANRYMEEPPPPRYDRYAPPPQRPHHRYRDRSRYDDGNAPRYNRNRVDNDERDAGRQRYDDEDLQDSRSRSIPSEGEEGSSYVKPDRAPAQPPKPADLPPSSSEKKAPSQNTLNAPTATRADKPGRVKSPFAPYNELDVSGMQSGSLAKDPSNGKVFRVP